MQLWCLCAYVPICLYGPRLRISRSRANGSKVHTLMSAPMSVPRCQWQDAQGRCHSLQAHARHVVAKAAILLSSIVFFSLRGRGGSTPESPRKVRIPVGRQLLTNELPRVLVLLLVVLSCVLVEGYILDMRSLSSRVTGDNIFG